jgi:hypothetical protein
MYLSLKFGDLRCISIILRTQGLHHVAKFLQLAHMLALGLLLTV